MSTKNKEFLIFIYERLNKIHGENPNVDYMLSLKSIIDGNNNKASNYKTITFKNGKTLEVTQEQANAIVKGIGNFGINQNHNIYNDDDSINICVNCEQIAFIS